MLLIINVFNVAVQRSSAEKHLLARIASKICPFVFTLKMIIQESLRFEALPTWIAGETWDAGCINTFVINLVISLVIINSLVISQFMGLNLIFMIESVWAEITFVLPLARLYFVTSL